MYTKENFLASVQQETDICKHLYTKILPNSLDYRPTPGQRSLLELMQFLTTCASTGVYYFKHNDGSLLKQDYESVKLIPAEQFCQKMDEQIVKINNLLSDVSEEHFNTFEAILPNGEPCVFGVALVDYVLKFMTAYRMQFFLYLKSTGVEDLNTFDCWFGIDKVWMNH